jgi:hypothetical protein
VTFTAERDDEGFLGQAAGLLAALPGVRAVTLGGSRATGTARPDSDWDLDWDWDFAVYYRGDTFDPARLRTLGWTGVVFPIGGWGGGVFNGGAWLRAGQRRVDVHYRDLNDVEHRIAEAEQGRFGIERLMFHLAGVDPQAAVSGLQIGSRPTGKMAA